jgi:hypothetical protein
MLTPPPPPQKKTSDGTGSTEATHWKEVSQETNIVNKYFPEFVNGKLKDTGFCRPKSRLYLVQNQKDM